MLRMWVGPGRCAPSSLAAGYFLSPFQGVAEGGAGSRACFAAAASFERKPSMWAWKLAGWHIPPTVDPCDDAMSGSMSWRRFEVVAIRRLLLAAGA